MRGPGSRKGHTRRGVFTTVTNRVTGAVMKKEVGIFHEGMQEGTVTHELIHAATSELIASPQNPAQERAKSKLIQVNQEVLRLIKTDFAQFSTLNKQEQNAFLSVGTSLDEFVTYTLTNAPFQSALKKLTFKGEKVSMFTKLSSIIKNLLGVKNVSDNAFSRALEAASGIVEATGPTRAVTDPIKTRAEMSRDSSEMLIRAAYKATLKGADERATVSGYSSFIKDMKKRYKEVNARLPKDTIQGREDFTQFIRAQSGQKISLTEIKLTRKITGKDGKIKIVQGTADVILRQTRKKRGVALKLLRCIQ